MPGLRIEIASQPKGVTPDTSDFRARSIKMQSDGTVGVGCRMTVRALDISIGRPCIWVSRNTVNISRTSAVAIGTIESGVGCIIPTILIRRISGDDKFVRFTFEDAVCNSLP